MEHRRTSRRGFLKRSLGATAFFAIPTTGAVPCRALKAMTINPPPSERVLVAHVGVGGRGTSLLRQTQRNAGSEVVAVCDVDQQRLHKAHALCWRGALATADYRRLLDLKDVDAIVIATPDHWHAAIATAACAAGKDVYVEKPLCTFLSEGRDMVAAARKHDRVVQVGIHHRSHPKMHEITRIVRSGRIGKVHTVKSWMWENPFKPRTPPIEPPAHLDFATWLGPAPVVPYHPERVHFKFRWCRDYAGGYMTDWGVHMLNVVTHAMDIDTKGPDAVAAEGEYEQENLYDFPKSMEARWQFSDPDFAMTWTQPSEGGDIAADRNYGMNFYGEAGVLKTWFHDYEFFVDGQKADLPSAAREEDLPPSPGHFQNFLDCVRSRERPIADVEIGHRTTSLCQLANIALDLGRELRWDWRAEKFIDDPAASGLLARAEHASPR